MVLSLRLSLRKAKSVLVKSLTNNEDKNRTPPGSTLKSIARETGLSLSAISYALRGAPNISAATIKRVRAAAEKLGYQANPRVTELMAHIRRGLPVARGEKIAFIWADTVWKKRFSKSLFHGVNQRASELGYGIEEFWLKEPRMTSSRLAQILHHRGIRGVIFSPLHQHHHFALDWDWTLFSSAILGNATCTPELHRVGHHHYLGMRLALKTLLEQGHRRIAALLNPETNERAKRAWSASFLEHHPSRAKARHFLLLEAQPQKAPVLRWLKKIQADVLICQSSTAHFLNSTSWRSSQPLRWVVLDKSSEKSPWSGIDQGEEILGAQAVDLVAAQLTQHEQGAPLHPKMLLYPGHWVEA
jgi:LacI family transcriptional regulator